MDLINQLQSLAKLIENNNGNITPEETTKSVLPMIAELKKLAKCSFELDNAAPATSDLITDEEFEGFFVVDISQPH